MDEAVVAEEVPDMIQDHEHDDEAAQLVDDLEARPGADLGLGDGVADQRFVEHSGILGPAGTPALPAR